MVCNAKTFASFAKVLSAFEAADNSVGLIYIPSIVLWEIAILQHLGRINLYERFDHWAGKLLRKQGFEIIPLEVSIIANAVAYNFNNDVFDKVIAASGRIRFAANDQRQRYC